jgi:ribosome-associated heat shock protein Hsp15
MDTPLRVRMDKWLWAVRIFKTRSLATAACDAGHIKVGGQSIKPARDVRVGEIITAFTGEVTRTLRVTALLDRRVAGKLVPQHLDDLTPPEEYERARAAALPANNPFPKGWGRPTKKQRRAWETAFPDSAD